MSLKSLLRCARLSQNDVAFVIGTKTAAVGHYCTGRRLMKYQHAVAIVDMLASRGVSCTVDSLMQRQAEMPKRNANTMLIASAASRMVKAAIDAGALPSLSDGRTQCVDCEKPADRYDHRNYAQPLVVAPVCNTCNQLRGPAAFVLPKAA